VSTVIRQEQLPLSVFAREFIGEEHGGIGISFLLVDAPPGRGPSLHRHPYDEIIIVQEGQATAVVGDEERQVRAGDIVLISANQPHGFSNSGDVPLRQIDIHVSPRFVTEWLTEQEGPERDSELG
jgi:mannose-6-phosphate isomerase-like protein (cupin superfamily)